MNNQADNRSLIRIVASDLDYLLEKWDAKVDDETLRRGSVIVRHLLVEGTLLRAWKVIGFRGQPKIIAPSLEEYLDSPGGRNILLALAGGGEIEGAFAANMIINKGPVAVGSQESYTTNTEFSFRLKDFLESCSLFAVGRRIKRREVIKYVANKLGGAHLDFRRDTSGAESIYVLLDRVAPSFDVFRKDAVFFELLSIGQLTARAPDIRQFVAAAKAKDLGEGVVREAP